MINTVVIFTILVWHLRVKGAGSLKTYLKVKSMILILMTLFELTVFYRYLVNFDFSVKLNVIFYNIVLVSSQSLESIIFFLICYFFTKKASVFLEDNQETRSKLRMTMWIAMITVVLITVM